MIHEVVIPVLDQTTTDVRLLHWLKSEGDEVGQGEVVCEIETDKATVEIEAPRAGVLRRILIAADKTIPPPLTVVALVGPADEALPKIDPVLPYPICRGGTLVEGGPRSAIHAGACAGETRGGEEGSRVATCTASRR